MTATSLLRLLALAAVLAASAGCGRRGSLEPPGAAATAPRSGSTTAGRPDPKASAPAPGPAAALDEEDDDTVSAAPVPAPSNRRRRGYTIPQGPFILDPIL